jgi:hypothetical protein
MPLLDHFRPPLSLRRHWNAFHNSWATYLSSQINALLPEGYFAEANVQFGIEIPLPVLTDLVEVQVFDSAGGPRLAGAIELVSPANKDRPASRAAFVSKCAAYVQQGIGLVIVDVVTDRHVNLHDELVAHLGAPDAVDSPGELYAVAYHPVQRGDDTELDIWPVSLTLGSDLPTLPLWLRGGPCLPVDLEAAYRRTCQEQRVLANGA